MLPARFCPTAKKLHCAKKMVLRNKQSGDATGSGSHDDVLKYKNRSRAYATEIEDLKQQIVSMTDNPVAHQLSGPRFPNRPKRNPSIKQSASSCDSCDDDDASHVSEATTGEEELEDSQSDASSVSSHVHDFADAVYNGKQPQRKGRKPFERG